MWLLLAVSPSGTAVPPEFWLWIAATLLLTAGLGFAAGYFYARWSVEWAVDRAKKQLSSLYELVVQSLEAAHAACALLENFPQMRLTTEQTETLECKRSGLQNTISSIVARQLAETTPPDDRAVAEKQLEPFSLEWTRSPEDPGTGLPSLGRPGRRRCPPADCARAR